MLILGLDSVVRVLQCLPSASHQGRSRFTLGARVLTEVQRKQIPEGTPHQGRRTQGFLAGQLVLWLVPSRAARRPGPSQRSPPPLWPSGILHTALLTGLTARAQACEALLN